MWGPQRRSTCSQALFDNLQSVSDQLREERSAGFSPDGTEIVFPAGTKNVFKNTVNFGAPAASILQRRLQDAVVDVEVQP